MKEKIVLPNYEHSVLNLIISILRHYNVETKHSSLKNIDKIIDKK